MKVEITGITMDIVEALGYNDVLEWQNLSYNSYNDRYDYTIEDKIVILGCYNDLVSIIVDGHTYAIDRNDFATIRVF